MATITVHNTSFRTDARLLAEMREVIAPSYDAEPAMFAHDISCCNRAYVLRDNSDLVAFFLTSFVEGDDPRCQRACIYLGLSATRQSHKNTGIVRSLFERFTDDARAFEIQVESAIPMFGTLATPSSYYSVNMIWANAEPLMDGSYSEKGREHARIALKWLNAEASDDHPFVLHAYAVGTRYSKLERERIARLIAKTQFSLLERLGVVEARGDRLLVVCEVPH